MNASRRKKITEVLDKVDALKTDILLIQADEQDYLNAMPDNIQMSARGEKAEAAISALDTVIYLFEEAIEQLTEAAQ